MELTINNIYEYTISSFEELNKILEDEKEVLLNNHGEDLLKVVEKKQVILKKITLLEKKRVDLSGKISSEEAIEKGYLTREGLNKLKDLAKEIEYKNETNKLLTKQSLNYIKAIKVSFAPKNNILTTYGNGGQIGEKTSDSIFSTTF